MNECTDFPHPADLANECSPMYPPKGWTSKKRFVSPGGGTTATGEGQAQSTISQQDADDRALEKAMDNAELLLRLKIYAISKIKEWWSKLTPEKGREIRDKSFSFISPAGTMDVWPQNLGRIEKKPWEYNVTACIPHLNTLEPLLTCIEILRNQTERPYIMVVDTGSSPEVCDILESIRDEDLEIHFIRAHAWQHSSESVAAALDLSHTLCRTKYLFQTHSDVFLMRFDLLEFLMNICNEEHPAVGNRMSPRDWATDEWEHMVGHVVSMFYMPVIHKIGATWSMQRMHHYDGEPWVHPNGWPDTETGFNRILKRNGIKPIFIGHDKNYVRQTDGNIDHARSYTGSRIYSAEHAHKCEAWMKDAMHDAKERLLSLTR